MSSTYQTRDQIIRKSDDRFFGKDDTQAQRATAEQRTREMIAANSNLPADRIALMQKCFDYALTQPAAWWEGLRSGKDVLTKAHKAMGL